MHGLTPWQASFRGKLVMRLAPTALVFAALLGWGLSPAPAPAAPPVENEDDQLLKNAKLGTDGPALLQFSRTRTRPKTDPDHIADLVRDLANDSDKISSKAMGQIISLGTVTVPWLRKALKDPDDALGAKRAKFCL